MRTSMISKAYARVCSSILAIAMALTLVPVSYVGAEDVDLADVALSATDPVITRSQMVTKWKMTISRLKQVSMVRLHL
jgi:hypothetical protein